MIWTQFASPGRTMPGGYGVSWSMIGQRSCSNNRFAFVLCVVVKPWEIEMAKGQQKGNREAKKPKKEKAKVIAAAPSQKAAGWQPTFGAGKKK
jgi:hypothetical protein